ncbi:hypothetical protein OG455_01170 [Kitasatospora sp. NBC_01287]|uniref:hypothetical protein n=1 Tax=Kitasatospora sp. NBC_01287 TaxID=2903573 RepID=UPI00225A381A|nr:hypothetical protein [Kitasatospora sp. NBC_01287]MCX4744135.1 hypothetical protein [Kitasatospora sp. NBC_01287]
MADEDPELSRDEVLRALAALEAGWQRDERGLAVLGERGPGERTLPALLAIYGERTLRALLTLAVGGQEGLSTQEAMDAADQLDRSVVGRISGVLGQALESWAETAGDDSVAAGHIARTVIGAIAAVSQDAEGDDVLPLIAALRTQTLRESC